MEQIKISSTDEKTRGYSKAFLMDENAMDHLIAKVCSIVEIVGLKDSQETATKSALKRAVYDVFGYDYGTRVIWQELAGVLRQVIHQEEEQAKEAGIPPFDSIRDYEIVSTPRVGKQVI